MLLHKLSDNKSTPNLHVSMMQGGFSTFSHSGAVLTMTKSGQFYNVKLAKLAHPP